MEQKQLIENSFDLTVAGIEPLETLEAASWGEFFGGVSIGLGVVGLVAAGAGIAVT